MNVYRGLVKEQLSGYAYMVRSGQGMTQQKMAEVLRITPRAYGDLERGKYCFSAVTLLFLFYLLEPDEIKILLEVFIKKVHTLENTDVV